MNDVALAVLAALGVDPQALPVTRVDISDAILQPVTVTLTVVPRGAFAARLAEEFAKQVAS